MHISLQALVLAALSLDGVLAQPAHRHQHKHRRDLADVLGAKLDLTKRVDFNNKALYEGLDWQTICAGGKCQPGQAPDQAPKQGAPKQGAPAGSAPVSSSVAPVPSSSQGSSPPPASTSTAPGPTGSDTSSSSGSGSGSCTYPSAVWDPSQADRSQKNIGKGQTGKCDGGCTSADGAKFSSFSGRTQATNDGTPDNYQGNVGTDYGHNMFPLSSCDVSSQKYSITFHNAADKKIDVAMWNKVGDNYKAPDTPGPITGAFRNAFWKFPLEAGQSAAFAVDENSQIAFSQACSRSGAGAFDCTWGEADFANESNKGYSGYDRSSIPNSQGNTGLLSVCVDGHDCSSAETHSFVSASQTDAGGNLAVSPGEPMHLKVTMG